MLLQPIALWEGLLFVFVGVAGVAFGLGWVVANRQHVVSTMRSTMAEQMDELRQGFRRDLELQLTRERARSAAELAEIRGEAALAKQEARMNAQMALGLQRRVEELEKKLIAGVVINAGGDVTTGGAVAGQDLTEQNNGHA